MPFGFISPSFNLSKQVNEPDKIAYYANLMFFQADCIHTKKELKQNRRQKKKPKKN